MAAASVLQKFQGSLVGAVIGDCIGAVFEGVWTSAMRIERVLKLVKKVESAAAAVGDSSKIEGKTWWLFTDDTAMARSVAASLIEKKELDSKDLAKRFTDEYFSDPLRGYGANVVTVFKELHDSHCGDPFTAAKKQFGGQGSYGNGGAMRISPAALFSYSDEFLKLKTLAETTTRITHSNTQAIHGAILQCYAVHLALHTTEIIVDTFIDSLLQRIKPLEEEEKNKNTVQTNPSSTESPPDTSSEEGILPYCCKLEKIREYVKQEEQPSAELIDKELGTDISAYGSVPTAIYAFLRSTKAINGVQDRNPFEKTVIYAISLGGDTDTIATMAGAIAGACYGIESVPEAWQKCCEGVQDAKDFADRLYKLRVQSKCK